MCSFKQTINKMNKNSLNNINNNIFYLFFTIILLSFIQNSENVILTNHPILLAENKGLNIVCNYTDENHRPVPIDWNWSKDDIKYNDFTEEDKQRITIHPKDKTIVISKASKSDIGNWKCESDKLHATIAVRSKPWLALFEEYQKTNYKSANVIEGEKFHLKCEVMEEYNRDAKVKWYKYNESQHPIEFKDLEPLSEDSQDSHVKIERKNASLAILTIDKVVPSDRFYYVCFADNDIANTNNTILLRVKDKLGALWPFLGIVAEVIILCTIIFIYEKRRIKPDFDESDNDNNTTEPKGTEDRSSKSQDVRQRK